MEIMDLRHASAMEAGTLLRERKISCAELLEYSLNMINKTDGLINAYAHVFEETARKQAARAQELLDHGNAPSPLCGVPMGIKDNICAKDTITSCGSRMLSNFAPPYSATAYEKLEEAGAVLLGKLNMDEFAMGGSTETYRGTGKEVLERIFHDDIDPEAYVLEHGLLMLGDPELVAKAVANALAKNPKSVGDYKSGKEKAFGFLVGQVMRELGGKANPKDVNAELKRQLL